MSTHQYVHGYSNTENIRLQDQAATLTELLHHDTKYLAGQKILEAGCGIGAQTITLAKNSPDAHFTSVDISESSIEQAKKNIAKHQLSNVSLKTADLFNLPYPEDSFDHVFVCFVLEHLPNPKEALQCLRMVLKKGGSITVIEGDHGSAFYYPPSDYAQKTIQCLIDLQEKMGGNSLIGRELYPLLKNIGFRNVNVSPRFVYADSSLPHMVDGFTRKTFTAMVAGVEAPAIEEKMIEKTTWEQGIQDLYRTGEEDGTFCYTFFKAIGTK